MNKAKSIKSPLIQKILKRIPENERYFNSRRREIAVKIKELIDKKGLTQRQFAELLGKSESEISKWLSGKHNLTTDTIFAIEFLLKDKIISTTVESPTIVTLKITTEESTSFSSNEYIDHPCFIESEIESQTSVKNLNNSESLTESI